MPSGAKTGNGQGLRVARRDGGAVVTLDDGRPATLLTTGLLVELAAALDDLASGPDRPGWVLLRGNGRGSFAAGADLAEIAALDSLSARRFAEAGQDAFERLARCAPWPTASLVDGHAFGGGFDLALACDLVLAAPRARFCHPGVERGLVTGWGGTARLPRAAGLAIARSALLAGQEFGAREAERAGFALPVGEGAAGAADAARRLEALAAWPRAARDAWRAARRGACERLVSALVRLAAVETGGSAPDRS